MAISDTDLFLVQREDTKYNVLWSQLKAAIGGGGGGANVNVGPNPPGDPNLGDLWWNSDNGILYVFYIDPSGDEYWVAATPEGPGGGESGGANVSVGVTPPVGPVVGDLWWKSDEGILYVYYEDPSGDLYWVDTNPTGIPIPKTASVGPNAPVEPPPQEGDLWWNDNTGIFYIYYVDPDLTEQWVAVTPQGGSGGGGGAVGNITGIAPITVTSDNDDFTIGVDSATETEEGVITDAPIDGQKYARQNAGWSVVTGGGGGVVIGTNPPVDPDAGQLWFDSNDGRLYIYYVDPDGTAQWVDASPDNYQAITSGVNPPNAAIPNDLWFNSETGAIFIYYEDPSGDSQWVDTAVGTEGGGGGGGASVSVSEEPPASPSVGDLWWDTSSDIARLFIFYDDVWVDTSPSGGGGSGGGGTSDQPKADFFYENDITLQSSYSITPGKNAMTAGPAVVPPGNVVTVPPGSTWTVVGSGGDTETNSNPTFNSVNTGQLAGFRNQIINGNMLIAQRGTGPVTSTALTGTYSTVDRFAVDDVTAQQFTITDLPGFSKGLSITAGGRYKIRQPVELETAGNNSQFGIGSTWTLSLYSTQDISSGSFTGYFVDGKEGTNFTVVVENQPWVLIETVGSWKRYAVSFTVNATPVATNKAFNVEMTVVAGTYTGVQLEPGLVATPFEQIPYQTQLANCQRYYQEFPENSWYGTPMNQFANESCMCSIFYAEKRVVPTITFNGTWSYRESGSATGNRTATPIAGVGYGARTSSSTISTGVTDNIIAANWIETGSLTLDAEL